MAWTRHQIITVQKYRRWAELPDCDYRGLLEEIGGARSSKDRGLTNWHFDRVMAAIESKLAYRVEEGFVEAPAGVKLSYWRTRLPADGEANSRQMHKVWSLWELLRPHLPEADRTTKYLAAIAAKACGYHVKDVFDLKAWQAHLLTEALKDRLQYALSHDCKTTAILGTPLSTASGPVAAAAPAAVSPGAGSCLHEMSEVPF